MPKRKINKIVNIIKEMEKVKVQYVIVGGIAVVFYGYVRATKDLDIILKFTPNNVHKFVSLMKRLGWIPRVPIDPFLMVDKRERDKWKREKGAKVFTFINPDDPLMAIDVLLDMDYSKIRKNRIRSRNIRAVVVKKEDLIEMKKQTGRLQDILDVENLKKISK